MHKDHAIHVYVLTTETEFIPTDVLMNELIKAHCNRLFARSNYTWRDNITENAEIAQNGENDTIYCVYIRELYWYFAPE